MLISIGIYLEILFNGQHKFAQYKNFKRSLEYKAEN